VPRTITLCFTLLAACVLRADNKLDPAEVKIEGALEYGQSSDPVEYSGNPRYSAFVFTANAQDRIEVTVKASDRKATVAIADGSLNELATGTTRVTFQIPNHGPDAEAYYIVFRDLEGKPGKFTVELKRAGQAASNQSSSERVARLGTGKPSSFLPVARVAAANSALNLLE
jgi:hypothetical protein